MPPRIPEIHAITRPPRGDGAASRRPPPERVIFALECRLKRAMSRAATSTALMARFGVSRASADRDLREARLQIEEEIKERVPFWLERRLEKLDAIAEDAAEQAATADVAGPLYAAAIAAIREQGKLIGAYAPERVEVTTTISDEDYAEEIEHLRAEAIAEAATSDLVAELERRGVRVPLLSDEAELVQ